MNPLPLVLATLRRDLRVAVSIVLLVACATSLGLAMMSAERALHAGAMRAVLEVVLLLAVSLIVVTALAARRPSIGALRALGAPKRFVLATIWIEVALLIGAGAALGALVGSLAGSLRLA